MMADGEVYVRILIGLQHRQKLDIVSLDNPHCNSVCVLKHFPHDLYHTNTWHHRKTRKMAFEDLVLCINIQNSVNLVFSLRKLLNVKKIVKQDHRSNFLSLMSMLKL